MQLSPNVKKANIAAVRHFNRFYTRAIGALDRTLMQSPFSLAEARVLFEIASRESPTAREIGQHLGLDAGYLSRMVTSFEQKKLVKRTPLPADRRNLQLILTAKGKKAFAKLDRNSERDVGSMLAQLPQNGQELVSAMTTIERLLDKTSKPQATLRPHRPGDMGWVIERHGGLYADEFGWDISFERTVMEIAAAFLKNFNENRECCWIAEIDAARVGSVFLVRKSDDVAQLRLLLVDPAARGAGVGKQLVAECIAFARKSGYRKLTLWTQSMLIAARAIYQAAGFKLVGSEPHLSFGKKLIGETWELKL